MKAVAIIVAGSGGQASVILDACLAAHVEVAGLVLAGEGVPLAKFNVPVLGNLELLSDTVFLRSHAVAFGSGDGKQRREFARAIVQHGGTLATVIHPAATVSSSAVIGDGSFVAAGSVIGPNAHVGRFCIINTCASIDHDNVLEDGVNLSPGVHFAGNVTCREDAFVGTGATAIPGVQIGRRAVVGADATVTADVPDDTTVVGTPARPIERAPDRS
jgi:sugar O-acyltransferase (sialic acid O-acetyltransferase NeuD family)